MPKKVKFESVKYRFLIAATSLRFSSDLTNQNWLKFLCGLEFIRRGSEIVISWSGPRSGVVEFDCRQAILYRRGDRSTEETDLDDQGAVKVANEGAFAELAREVARVAGFSEGAM